jgi:hypothetical protein
MTHHYIHEIKKHGLDCTLGHAFLLFEFWGNEIDKFMRSAQHNFSQASLAEKLDVSRQTINAIETRRYEEKQKTTF